MSSPETTSVSLTATLDYNGTPIVVNTGDLAQLKAGVFKFSLSEPLVLGSVDDFLDWLHNEWHLPDLHKDVDSVLTAIENVPILGNIAEAFRDFLAGTITITLLSVNATGTSRTYQIAVTLTLQQPANLFGPINFDSIGVQVSNMPSS